jgi:hypothetical protein
MEKFFTFVLLLIAFTATAQDIKEIKFTTGTVTYENIQAPVRRSEAGEIEKYLASGGKNASIATALMRIEKELDDAQAYLRAGKKMVSWLPHTYSLIAQVKKAESKFSVAEYTQEAKLYEVYNERLALRQRQQYAAADSFKKIQKRQEVRAQKETEAMKMARLRKQDSVKRVYDSLGRIALLRETKAREEFCIKKFGKEFGPQIANGQVANGMNQEMCLTAWGEPSNKKKTEREGVKIEIWNYGPTGWLKFQDGLLVASSGVK